MTKLSNVANDVSSPTCALLELLIVFTGDKRSECLIFSQNKTNQVLFDLVFPCVVMN